MVESKVTRNSKQKTAILQVLAGTTSHPTADWVYQQVSLDIPNISLGTVYRNLSQLAASGTIQRMEIGDGTDHFDYNTEPHDHFYCRSCGCLYDFPLPYDNSIDKLAADANFGMIDRHNLIYQGVCKGCLSTNEKE